MASQSVVLPGLVRVDGEEDAPLRPREVETAQRAEALDPDALDPHASSGFGRRGRAARRARRARAGARGRRRGARAVFDGAVAPRHRGRPRSGPPPSAGPALRPEAAVWSRTERCLTRGASARAVSAGRAPKGCVPVSVSRTRSPAPTPRRPRRSRSARRARPLEIASRRRQVVDDAGVGRERLDARRLDRRERDLEKDAGTRLVEAAAGRAAGIGPARAPRVVLDEVGMVVVSERRPRETRVEDLASRKTAPCAWRRAESPGPDSSRASRGGGGARAASGARRRRRERALDDDGGRQERAPVTVGVVAPRERHRRPRPVRGRRRRSPATRRMPSAASTDGS